MSKANITTLDDRHQEIAETFYKNIEYDHPRTVSSDRMCRFCYNCRWEATSVKYYTYTGPDVKNI